MSFELATVQKKVPEGARIISNSEVDTFLTCQKKWFFAFILGKEPKTKSRSLNIGIIGHEIQAEYYRFIKAGAGKSAAYQAAMKLLTKYFATTDDYEPLSVVQKLFNRYVEQDTLADNAEILAVEEDFYLPINDEIWYAMRLDLLVRSISGRSAGNINLVDHKFTYDFYSPDDLKLNPQTPKYVGALRFNGVPVYDGYLNQLRTRFPAHLIDKKTDADLFRMDRTATTPERIKQSFRQQIIASERIIDRRALPMDLQVQESIPILNRMVCRNCPFKLPCQMSEDGIPITSVMQSQFMDRSYGYKVVAAIAAED